MSEPVFWVVERDGERPPLVLRCRAYGCPLEERCALSNLCAPSVDRRVYEVATMRPPPERWGGACKWYKAAPLGTTVEPEPAPEMVYGVAGGQGRPAQALAREGMVVGIALLSVLAGALAAVLAALLAGGCHG